MLEASGTSWCSWGATLVSSFAGILMAGVLSPGKRTFIQGRQKVECKLPVAVTQESGALDQQMQVRALCACSVTKGSSSKRLAKPKIRFLSLRL